MYMPILPQPVMDPAIERIILTGKSFVDERRKEFKQPKGVLLAIKRRGMWVWSNEPLPIDLDLKKLPEGTVTDASTHEGDPVNKAMASVDAHVAEGK